jgi:DNA polymerase-3 subunit epsilon
MRRADFAVVDVETTGLSPAFGDRVCEIAIVHLQGNTELETFSTLINPGRPISPGAAAVNGITDAMVATAPSFRDVASEIVRHLDGSVFVAHNAPFDLAFLAAEFQRLRTPLPVMHVIDTLAIARQFYAFSSNSLSAIAAHLDLPYPQQHRAAHDARVTGQVLRAFLRDLARRRMATVADVIFPAPEALFSGTEADLVLPPVLSEAITQGLTLEICYAAAGAEVGTRRRIDPLTVIPNRAAVYLRAYCHLRQDERTFRLDRITEMRIVGKGSFATVVTAERRRRPARKR